MAAIKALEQWCKTQCEGYRDVTITNMTTSFRSGLAFCALIHKYRPDLIDYDSLRMEDVFKNNSLAFQVAEEKLGIPALLDAEDMVALRIPDRLSILTYVSQYHNYFKGRPPMGGVKRPAEGSKEEPSEKKNLPVVAKTFVSKTTIENHFAPTHTSQTSPKLSRAAPQKAVLAENANKNGTLNSKCVVCKSHVHLVQRHFVEGKLYHRSCFKCSECSSVLHAGGYKPGKEPDTFICNAHQSKPSSSEARIKNGPTSSSGHLNSARKTEPAPRPSSVLSAPLDIVLKPVGASHPSQSWTTSAQRTQAARQRFFQAVPPVSKALTDDRKLTEPSNILGRPKVSLSPDDEKSRARTVIGKKLAEENCNNNNKRPFTIRSAERRLEHQYRCADPANEWQTKLKPVKTKPAVRDVEASTEQRKPGFISTTSPDISIGVTRPPVAPTPAAPPVNFTLFDPAHLSEVTPQKSQHGSGNLRAKKGKYLSPTNASSTEMRSPSMKSYNILTEQIERELNDIETNLAQLEKEGVELEKKLRSCEEEGEGDILMDPLMVDWFNLIRKKQMYIRKESELVYIARTQELEQQQPGVEGELRRLLEKPDHLKSIEEQQREKKLMQRLMDIVDGRNAIVEGLDEDRLRRHHSLTC
ncbi:hypothetical protein PAMP_009077 [Pampus punctatissimus]